MSYKDDSSFVGDCTVWNMIWLGGGRRDTHVIGHEEDGNSLAEVSIEKYS